MAEAGFANFEAVAWFGILAPRGTPEPVVQRLNADVNALLSTPDLREKFAATGAEPLPSTPERFAEMLRNDLGKWGKVVRDSGARVD